MVTESQKRLIKTVQNYQFLHQFSDSDFAELLGISPSHWQRTTRFERNPGVRFFRGIGKIKELRMALYEYFTTD